MVESRRLGCRQRSHVTARLSYSFKRSSSHGAPVDAVRSVSSRIMLKTLRIAVFGVVIVSVALTTASAMVQSGADRSADAGWQALQAGDGDRAAGLFREALERNPRDPALHLGAGLASHLLGRETDATQSLKRALELEPKLVVASLVLGLIQYQSGDVDAAIHTYELALAYAPANLELRGNLDRWRKEAALHQTLQ